MPKPKLQVSGFGIGGRVFEQPKGDRKIEIVSCSPGVGLPVLKSSLNLEMQGKYNVSNALHTNDPMVA